MYHKLSPIDYPLKTILLLNYYFLQRFNIYYCLEIAIIKYGKTTKVFDFFLKHQQIKYYYLQLLED